MARVPVIARRGPCRLVSLGVADVVRIAGEFPALAGGGAAMASRTAGIAAFQGFAVEVRVGLFDNPAHGPLGTDTMMMVPSAGMGSGT